ncbi:hypothetical protein HID58_003562, partial [Brassica napus]
HDRVSESLDRYDAFDLSDNPIFAIDGGIRNIRRKRVLCDTTEFLFHPCRQCSKIGIVTKMQMGSLLCTKEKSHNLMIFSSHRYIGYSFKLFEPIYNTLLA